MKSDLDLYRISKQYLFKALYEHSYRYYTIEEEIQMDLDKDLKEAGALDDGRIDMEFCLERFEVMKKAREGDEQAIMCIKALYPTLKWTFKGRRIV